ncbi:MAG: hypothetical protein KC501_36410 [Myxococcales bacterium]|nr:hypothetical protein [Myxococcales bacterium]
MLALMVGSGCAKRLALVPAELERVQKEAGSLDPLRVYVSKRLITVYTEAQVAQDFTVDKQIVQQSDRQQLKNILLKTDSGKILKIEESNGMPLLWVTFDASCNTPDCAFGFVQNEDGLHRLIKAPPLEGYAEPKNYHVRFNDRRLMKLGKMKSLSEANDVFVNKRRNGKLRTIHLEVIKVIDDRTRTRTRRSGGVD